MYVKADRGNLQAIKTAEMDKKAVFSDNNIAQVEQSDGEALLDKHPEIFSEHTNS
jgi:hypothetical protein